MQLLRELPFFSSPRRPHTPPAAVELARVSHPDGRRRRASPDDIIDDYDDDDDDDERGGKDSTVVDDFVRIRAAYEHLTKEGGIINS